MTKWCVYKGNQRWVARRDWHVAVFPTWEAAFRYAYRHAVAAIHEVP